ncbi:DEAD/DEAH box helicase [Neorhizobium alkalisoli]|uniref:Transcription-repair-coupling factor n=1 Tax=Neorhizobium alkalisoli TaxID=528178 RepID=A0A561QBL6_9HYPH|nr:DEAD/DEAH box helicase [Neorhizobium alkalisoli]TWF47766.1 transcription-repair coupling factor (superfamily II helicase) [Neorhizobium alkalisoli]
MSVVESRDENASPLPAPADNTEVSKPPPGVIATRLAAALKCSERPLCYVESSEGAAARIAEALRALLPEIEIIVFPPWDCLPYDRVPPSPHCMGLRMDALRIWSTPSNGPRLFLTSLDATLQRVPPATVISKSLIEFEVGKPFDRDAFSDFVQRTGYQAEGVADDPGELAIREAVIDIYPAGAPGPMRIVLSEDETVKELRGFDRSTQRTESYLDQVTFGPASEAIYTEGITYDHGPALETMEQLLLRLYQHMPTVFDILGDTKVLLAPGATERMERYLEIIEDARQSREEFDDKEPPSCRSLYLDRAEWERLSSRVCTDVLDPEQGNSFPLQISRGDQRKALIEFVQDHQRKGMKVVITGNGKTAEAICRRLAKADGKVLRSVDTWEAVLEAEPGTLLRLACDLEQGFIDVRQNVVVMAATDRPGRIGKSSTILAEAELQIGDVVVHEDHGVGVLKDLEAITVDDVLRDAARLEYRDGGSLLVPMEEFGKLWRYGSEPEAITLDRLHTDAWQKKRDKITADVQSTARHFMKVAKQREAEQAEKFVPPRAEFSAFARRFPFSETPDQADAIQSVLSDLSSGRPLNRLVCGDVGFGKTEVALRAAAAVALAGGQVALIAPTTVLARQHFSTFKHRFMGTGISVGMLSRLLKPSAAKKTKIALAEGELDIIIATQSILSKDVRFDRLSLLIVDEEHRFGLKEKRAMATLAPFLHRLSMSATPIPRTLQSAMVGVQEVSLLATPPSRRRPVRTSLSPLDPASLRSGLMREYRRRGQSFIVVPRIGDIEKVGALLHKIVPELSVRVAHGEMQAADIDEAIVRFAQGDGDILLATNIIENGLDVPRANTMFVWHADRFGLAQLHQLRGRVGRGTVQGIVTLLTEHGAELAEDTRIRLSTLVENDRLGSGLAISLQDLDLRGGGDIAGEDQAGHMKAIGTGLYQKLLAGAVARLRRQPLGVQQRAVVNLGEVGTIPSKYVSDPAVRLNLYAKLLRSSMVNELNDLEDEFEDRFGDPPHDTLRLLRTSKLQLIAGQLGVAKLEAGPKALAITLTENTSSEVLAASKKAGAVLREDRLIFEASSLAGEDPSHFFHRVLSAAVG